MAQNERVGGDDLVINNLHYSYGGAMSIFNNFNLTVKPGEFLSILGPSGCGKTTMLNLLAGFYDPEQGDILLRGDKIYPEDPHLGYVFQSSNLFPWLTAIENVEFGLKMAGKLSASERRDKAKQYLDMVGLNGFDEFLPGKLSGGMQQRVSLARTLVLEPHLLLMDEPFAALDAITRETMNDELLRLWDELGQTVVFITHDIDEAIYLSDRVVVLGRPPNGIHRELINELPRPRSGPTTRTAEIFWQYKKELITDIATVTKESPRDAAEMVEIDLQAGGRK